MEIFTHHAIPNWPRTSN